jgi:hypothetical protein
MCTHAHNVFIYRTTVNPPAPLPTHLSSLHRLVTLAAWWAPLAAPWRCLTARWLLGMCCTSETQQVRIQTMSHLPKLCFLNPDCKFAIAAF